MLSEKHVNALPRRELVRGRTHVSRLFNQGSRLKGGFLLMIVFPYKPESALATRSLVRLLFSVGKKPVPRAVDRNRIKRLMREAYRMEKGVLSCTGIHGEGAGRLHYSLAILYRGRADSIPSLEEFRDETRRLLKNFDLKRSSQSNNGGRIG
jgi:ribonuclease P protein component